LSGLAVVVALAGSGMVSAWVAGDDVFGASGPRRDLQDRRIGYVLAVGKDQLGRTGYDQCHGVDMFRSQVRLRGATFHGPGSV
jgi:hypothetical protein